MRRFSIVKVLSKLLVIIICFLMLPSCGNREYVYYADKNVHSWTHSSYGNPSISPVDDNGYCYYVKGSEYSGSEAPTSFALGMLNTIYSANLVAIDAKTGVTSEIAIPQIDDHQVCYVITYDKSTYALVTQDYSHSYSYLYKVDPFSLSLEEVDINSVPLGLGEGWQVNREFKFTNHSFYYENSIEFEELKRRLLVSDGEKVAEIDIRAITGISIFDIRAIVPIGESRYSIAFRDDTAVNEIVIALDLHDINNPILIDAVDAVPEWCLLGGESHRIYDEKNEFIDIVIDNTGIYKLNNGQKDSVIVDFSKCNFSGADYAKVNPMKLDKNGKLTSLFSEQLYYTLKVSTLDFVREEIDSSREIITLGSVGGLTSEVEQSISDFNRSNKDYYVITRRINVLQFFYKAVEIDSYASAYVLDPVYDMYLAKSELENEIRVRIEEDGYDIVILDEYKFPSEDMFTDLSDLLNEEGLFGNIMEASSVNGKLYEIPLMMDVCGICYGAPIDSLEIVDYMSYDEYLNAPEFMIFDVFNAYCRSKSEKAAYLLSMQYKSFIAEDGLLELNDDRFYDMLNFSNELALDATSNGNSFGVWDNFYLSEYFFGGYAGLYQKLSAFPSSDKIGFTAIPVNTIAIPSSSGNVPGAMEVIRSILGNMTLNSYYLPINREAVINAEMEDEYKDIILALGDNVCSIKIEDPSLYSGCYQIVERYFDGELSEEETANLLEEYYFTSGE